MPWVESASRSFRARYDSASHDDAVRVLHSLELTRERLDGYFPAAVGGLTVVLHRSTLSLALAQPTVTLARAATAPAARRYVAGWAGRQELHMLEPRALEARASAVSGSREMLELSAPALYARRVIGESNSDLPARPTPKRALAELRWGWMLEGAARWFAGQTDYARPAIARRLHEGGPPRFPPGPRDALLLGGTVIDLLAREQGTRAAAEFACRFHPGGPRAALTRAFDGRPFRRTEEAWRTHLSQLAGVAQPVLRRSG
ncbi:MAG TPA: hypothetical protein VMD09_11545 [Solirubrobacteraceae bacterium]|nr:hypothetical protein [Solirubrobacteraceae bacterium]